LLKLAFGAFQLVSPFAGSTPQITIETG
jgi:hypothetical protein